MPVRFKDNSRLAKVKTHAALKRFMVTQGLKVQRTAQDSMRGGGIPHVPSSPGEPPAVDTGTLRRSVQMEVQDAPTLIIVRVGTNLKYGLFLEIGTVHIQPRPWLLPAFLTLFQRAA